MPSRRRTVPNVYPRLALGRLIGNDGFQYPFEGDFDGDPRYRITAAAYQKIGADQAYAAFCDAFAIFPSSEVPANVEERLRIYEAHPEERRQAIDNRFFAADDGRKRLLA